VEKPDAPVRPARRLLRAAVRLVGPVLLLVCILRLPDPGAIGRTLASAALWPFLLAIALTFVNLQMKVTRWDVILRARGVRYPQRRAWAAFLGSSYVGMLTPGRVGDALRAQYLKRDLDVGYAEGLASVVMDRLCDLYVLAVFSAIGVVRFSGALSRELAGVAWGTVALTALGPLLFLVPGVAERLLGAAWRKLAPDRDAGGFDRFLVALRAQVGRPLLLTIPLTVLAFLVNYLQGWLLGRALHLEISLYDATCLLAIASLLSLLPVSVSGVGVREGFFAIAFPVLGLGAETGISFGLLVFAVIHLVMIGVGFVAWQISPPPMAARPT
jgi:glycosyltransferase 2 family protein